MNNEITEPESWWKRNSPSDTLDHRPITFPFWMVREIALDLEEKQQLELEVQLYALEVETYQKLQESMQGQEQKRLLQLELMGKNTELLESQLLAEKQIKKGAGTVVWSLRLLAAIGTGFMLGRL